MPKFQGAIFDVDGVLVDSPHEKAWRESLRELMEGDWSGIRARTTWSPDAFTPRVYEEQLSGKPRMSGARAALQYFHVPDDEEDHRLLQYAERKQAMVVRLIEAGDFTAYPDALRFIIAVKDAGLLIADASSSKNAGLFLRKIRLDTFAKEQGISSPSVRPGATCAHGTSAWIVVAPSDFMRSSPSVVSDGLPLSSRPSSWKIESIDVAACALGAARARRTRHGSGPLPSTRKAMPATVTAAAALLMAEAASRTRALWT